MKKKTKKPPPSVFPVGTWFTMATLGLQVVKDGIRLLVSVNPSPTGEKWGATAIEVAADAASPEAVFANHAHMSLGVFDNAASALRRAEVYTRAWLRKKRAPAPACPCPEIGRSR